MHLYELLLHQSSRLLTLLDSSEGSELLHQCYAYMAYGSGMLWWCDLVLEFFNIFVSMHVSIIVQRRMQQAQNVMHLCCA